MANRFLLFSLCCAMFFAFETHAQDTIPYVQLKDVDIAPIAPGCEDVEPQRAQFQCFQATVNDYIKSNLVYPPEAKKENIKGRVILRFLIDSEGKVQEVSVVRNAHQLLDQEAIRVIESLPTFQPAQKDGSNVAVQFHFPINFQL